MPYRAWMPVVEGREHRVELEWGFSRKSKRWRRLANPLFGEESLEKYLSRERLLNSAGSLMIKVDGSTVVYHDFEDIGKVEARFDVAGKTAVISNSKIAVPHWELHIAGKLVER